MGSSAGCIQASLAAPLPSHIVRSGIATSPPCPARTVIANAGSRPVDVAGGVSAVEFGARGVQPSTASRARHASAAQGALWQIASERATCNFSDGFHNAKRRNPRMFPSWNMTLLHGMRCHQDGKSCARSSRRSRCFARPQGHEKWYSAEASVAANSGCRCLRSLRTMALFSRARRAFTGDI